MDRFPGLPPDASAHGAEIDLLMGLVHWFIIAFFLAWAGYFVYALVRFRASARKGAPYRGPKGRWILISAVVVVTAELILDFGFSIPFWTARVEGIPDPADATEVRIVAEQYAWNVHYPGPDGLFGATSVDLVGSDNPLGLDRSDPAAADDITTVNLLYVPVGRPVLIHLTSKDVIHSLNLPAFRVKQDAVPGLSAPVWFIPTRTTEEVRDEMTNAFDIGAAVATESVLELPAIEEIDPASAPSGDGYVLLEDREDRDGNPLASAGDELDETTARTLSAAGVTLVRACIPPAFERYVSVERYADENGTLLLERDATVSVDVVLKLLAAGLTSVRVRERSDVDPWMVMETILGPGGEVVADRGGYLTEEIITECASIGLRTIAVAPLTPTEIACAQLCGLGHYRMRGEVVVLTEDEYREWTEAQQESLMQTY